MDIIVSMLIAGGIVAVAVVAGLAVLWFAFDLEMHHHYRGD